MLEREPDLSRLPATHPPQSDGSSADVSPKIGRSDYNISAMRESKSRSVDRAVAGSHHGRDDAAESCGSGARRIPWVAGVIATAVVAGVVGWRARPQPPAQDAGRFTIGTLPPGSLLVGEHPEVAISPEGTRNRGRVRATPPRLNASSIFASSISSKLRPSGGRKGGATQLSRPMASQ